MDPYSSGEDFIIKTRKPYTITKQRERWTEEEHNRFLEALKLYGRAWQRIEEHIGTKTAVQIRSHAQKFFSKLEKEALVKGVPAGQALDIDIPPPRPKRKPNNPYPRKTCAGAPISQVGPKDGKYFSSESSLDCKQVPDLGEEPLPKQTSGEGKPTYTKEYQDDDCSEVLTQLQGTNSSSAYNSSWPKPPVGLGNVCSFREFVPSARKAIQDDANGSHVTAEITGGKNAQKDDAKEMEIEDNNAGQGSLQFGDKMDDLSCELQTEEMQATQNYPRHVPVQVLDGSTGTHSLDTQFRDPNFHPNLFASSAASATTEHQTDFSRSPAHHAPFQPFHPRFGQIHHSQDDYQSFLHMSSAFSSLVVSTLLQNPVAHAAASYAATFWPYGKTPADPPRQISSSAPSMAAIAAATVAVATAWWASHGLLPMCAFPCTPPPSAVGGAPLHDTATGPQAPVPKPEEALQAQDSDTKSSSSDSKKRAGEVNPQANSKPAGGENTGETTELQDSDKARKRVDRSSCGSNTASSSDIETDALEKKGNNNNAKEEEKESEDDDNNNNNNPTSDSNIRRSRSTSTSSDSWKEVSEEGRLAFQALFSRQVLPQSFSTPPDMKSKENVSCPQEEERDGVTSLLDLNIRAWAQQEPEKSTAPRVDANNSDEGLLTIGLGQGKLKFRRTGFKPYKRCSVEAKETRFVVSPSVTQVEEKGNKRLRGDVQLNI